MLRHRILDDDAGDDRSGQCIQQGEEFLQFVQIGVSDVNDVLVVHREALREEVGFGIAQIESVDDGRGAVRTGLQLWTAKGFDDAGRLEPEAS